MAKKTEAVEAELVEDRQEFVQIRKERGGVFWGLLLMALGGMFIAEMFVDLNLWQYFWPGILIVFGFSLVVRSFGR